MERKRVRYKGSAIDFNNEDESISGNAYVMSTKEREIEDSDSEVRTSEKKDLQQSCIFDPSFSIDCSSSDSARSSSSNEWLNCEDDNEEKEEENPQSSASVSVVQNRKFALADFIPSRRNTCPDELSEHEVTRCYQSSQTLPEHEANKPFKKNEVNNIYIQKTLRNKIQLSEKRIEPYFEENFLTGNPQALLSSISKFYIGGYNKLTSLAGYVSESESSVYSECGANKAIKSILKRECKNQKGHNPKKKVRFDLGFRSNHDVSSGIRQLPIANNTKASDENLNYEIKIKSKPIELDRSHNYSERRSSKEQIVENNVEVYREQCNDQNYFTTKESFKNTKQNDEIRQTACILSRECEKVSLELLGTEKLLEESSKVLEPLKSKGTRNQFSVFQSNTNSNNLLSSSINLLPSAPLVQSEQLETDSEKATCSEVNKIKTEDLIESGLANQSPITEGEYSLFIKDLVNGSGDKLAKFLINLSSEISLKSGEEKISNALMTVGFLQEENKSFDTSKEMNGKTLNGNVRVAESNMDSNKYEKDIESLKKIHTNVLNSVTKKNGKNLVINKRRSASEVDINRVKPKKPHCHSYREKRFHNSRVDQTFVKEANNDSMRHDSSKYPLNTNSEVMGKLYEIMAELKQNVDKICRKESTIRIENAQIWLKEKEQVEKGMPTKETYSQTTETISGHAGDHTEKQTESETKILFFSNSEIDKINIKLNDKSTKNRFMPESKEENNTEYELNEIEERKRYFEKNRHIPFHVVFNDKTHLPTLKKGKYEVEIFEKMDGQDDTHFKNMMKKITGSLNSIKLNGFQSYDKSRNIKDSSSNSSQSRNNSQEKSEPNFLGTLLNKLLKLKINLPAKKGNSQFLDSELFDGTDQVSVLKSFNPDYKEDKIFSAKGSNNIGPFNMGHIFSKCNRERMNMYEDNSWPDVVKTKYPNGMVYFGPLTLMPEPNCAVYEWHSKEPETCPCSKFAGCHQYVFNKHMKHMLKASMSRNLSHQPEGKISLEAFSETEEEFYQLWNEMDKV